MLNNLKQSTFFLVLGCLMVGMTIGNFWNISVLWTRFTMGARLSSVFSILFNVALAFGFFWMYKTNLDLEKSMGSVNIDEIMEKYK